MRPHQYDEDHNAAVGQHFRDMVGDLLREGFGPGEIDRAIGAAVNGVARAAYDLGVSEVAPSLN